MKVVVSSPAELSALAAKLTPHLKSGQIVTLTGELAAGKTTFTQALLQAMGYQGSVNSPTFVIEHRYPVNWLGITTVLHLDLYRLSEKDLATLDWDDYLEPKNQLTIIEWPEKAATYLPKTVKTVTIELLNEKSRRFTVPDDLIN